ncbi:MAG: bifunctional 2-C-methyl-D-erythritol 4-phosphate cytidylyltransferase/2-C-methyl-D-erythritol 2,4-cyclodiphosphate synthase [Alphaproteobacteria bacterium]|nr:bifunctional 2-C-methyl-D-erythritol 4-phosphate cytidylyltransferase/2-C-methyl-D-erythritol 2,4-cyclodiphosphate synthase [Alphaproteobacteria bacterium]
MCTNAIIVSAGHGIRACAHTDEIPKQFSFLAGKSLISHTLRPFLNHKKIKNIIVVIAPGQHSLLLQALGNEINRIVFVYGGATRQESVAAGLDACNSQSPRYVLVHDAARPFVTPLLIDRVIAALSSYEAVFPAIPVTDTLKKISNGGKMKTIDREGLFSAQTPQGFHYPVIHEAHIQAKSTGKNNFTDDAALIEWKGGKVHIVPGDADNVKLTTNIDMLWAEKALKAEKALPLQPVMETRTGHGFDAHAFISPNTGNETGVTLCGIFIPHCFPLEGYSDADVGLHALSDAIFGALCDGDIGQHFPPGEPAWKNKDSAFFLQYASNSVLNRDGKIIHLDVTLICQKPKIQTHRDKMRERIVQITSVPLSSVSVKATTTERMGFTGRCEGIAAMATATLRLPAVSIGENVHEAT